MALVSSTISNTRVIQLFKENGKCKEDVSSITAIRFVLSGKEVSLVDVPISELLFPIKSFSEFTTKFFFNSRVI